MIVNIFLKFISKLMKFLIDTLYIYIWFNLDIGAGTVRTKQPSWRVIISSFDLLRTAAIVPYSYIPLTPLNLIFWSSFVRDWFDQALDDDHWHKTGTLYISPNFLEDDGPASPTTISKRRLLQLLCYQIFVMSWYIIFYWKYFFIFYTYWCLVKKVSTGYLKRYNN